MTDIEAARQLEDLRTMATPMQCEALGLGAMALRNRGPKRKEVKRLLALLDAVSVKHAIAKLNGKEEADEPEAVPQLRP